MRFPDQSLHALIAGSMFFVVEKRCATNPDCLGSCYVVEQSSTQFYNAKNLHVNRHFQVMHLQLGNLTAYLKHMGLQQVEVPSATGSACQHYTLRKGTYSILSKDIDYFLDEIIVVNNVMDNPALAQFADEIPFEAIAQKMFDDDYKELMFTGGKKGNLRYDAGYTAMNQTDSSVIPGMNLPHRLISTKVMAGLGQDETFELTLFKPGVNIMRILDHVQELGRRTRRRGKSHFAPLFPKKARDSIFGGNWAKDLGLLHLQRYARFNALSCFGTGETSDFRVIKSECHVDEQNARSDDERNTPTLTSVVPVRYQWGTVYVRIGINLYKKKCCDDAWKQCGINKKILKDFT